MEYLDLIGKQFEYGAQGPDKFDCWTLARELYLRMGIVLPPFASTDDCNLINQMVNQGKELFISIEMPESFCIVLFMVRPPYVSHIGVVLEDCQRFIHAAREQAVAIERLDSHLWRRRIKGYYKYV